MAELIYVTRSSTQTPPSVSVSVHMPHIRVADQYHEFATKCKAHAASNAGDGSVRLTYSCDQEIIDNLPLIAKAVCSYRYVPYGTEVEIVFEKTRKRFIITDDDEMIERPAPKARTVHIYQAGQIIASYPEADTYRISEGSIPGCLRISAIKWKDVNKNRYDVLATHEGEGLSVGDIKGE